MGSPNIHLVPNTYNAALSGLKLWVEIFSEAKRNPLFYFRLSALLYAFYTTTHIVEVALYFAS